MLYGIDQPSCDIARAFFEVLYWHAAGQLDVSRARFRAGRHSASVEGALSPAVPNLPRRGRGLPCRMPSCDREWALVDAAVLGVPERHAKMFEFADGGGTASGHVDSMASWSPSQLDRSRETDLRH
jgi:hypothetical protein